MQENRAKTHKCITISREREAKVGFWFKEETREREIRTVIEVRNSVLGAHFWREAFQWKSKEDGYADSAIVRGREEKRGQILL